jgi:hypothetical protein
MSLSPRSSLPVVPHSYAKPLELALGLSGTRIVAALTGCLKQDEPVNGLLARLVFGLRGHPKILQKKTFRRIRGR